VIRKIAIQGLQREPEASILAGLKIQIGEVYEPARVSEETGTLFRTRKFRKVEPQVAEFEDGVAITFVVEERPIIESVALVGRKALKDSFLRKSPPELRTKEKGLLNEAHVAEDVNTILEKYLDAGYIFAQVRSEVVETPLGARITFFIEEGTRVRIREVKFVGNRSIDSNDLLGVMSTREKDFWFLGLIRPGFYDPMELERDLVVLETYYQRFGYLDAQAEVDDISLDPLKERMTIVIRIREGSQYTFRGYRFSNNVVFSDETLRDLTRAIPGQPFSAEVLLADQKTLEEYYGDRAYIFATVNPKLVPEIEGADVHVRFEIEEKNEIYIEEVKIEGNVRTQDRVVRRELEFYPGERVDLSKLTKSRSNLNRLQIFRPVDYGFENGSTPSQKNVIVKIEEETPGRLMLGFGVTSGFGVIGNFRIIKQNFDITDLPESLYEIQDSFTGAGQTLDIQIQPGTQRSFYRLNFVEPYIFDTRNALGLSAQRLTILREDWEEEHLSFTPEVRHAFDFDRDLVFSMGYRIERVDITDLESDAPPDAVAAKGVTTISAVDVGMRHNKLLYEYLEGPYDGTLNAVTYEYGGGFLGEELDFHRVDVVNELYYPLFTTGSGPNTFHHIISLANRFGIIEPHGDTTSIPIFERYYLGGANTVRGFEFRGLGPHQGNDPVGGTVQLWGNLEYSFPILFKLLRGVIFFDYGNLDTDYEAFDISNMRLATGVGLRINFPFLGQPLPIGLYLGYPIRKEPDDEKEFFLFTIGAPF
jgi:outer membrane protein insertion porin family